MIRQWQSLFYESRYFEADLHSSPDFVKLADAYGISGFRAHNCNLFLKALETAGLALSEGRSFLIDAIIDKDEKVLPMVPSGASIDKQIL